MPSSRFRDFWRPLPAGSLEAGDAWSDTVSFVAEPGEGLRESYRAVRHHRVLGDTTIDGRAVPWIRSEAEVEYHADHLDMPPGGVRAIDYDLGGRTVAVMAVDTATGLRMAGTDTSYWEGRAVLHDSVRGPLGSDVRLERVRSWTWYDSAGFQAFQDSAREAGARSRTGMLILPTGRLEERLVAGDTLLADSLVARWRETRPPSPGRGAGRSLRP